MTTTYTTPKPPPPSSIPKKKIAALLLGTSANLNNPNASARKSVDSSNPKAEGNLTGVYKDIGKMGEYFQSISSTMPVYCDFGDSVTIQTARNKIQKLFKEDLNEMVWF